MANQPPQADAPDETYAHLQLIQPVITRMSSASSSAKSWLLPVVTATYGYAITSQNPWIALLGVAAVVLFLFQDANYLREERRYRALSKSVAEGKDSARFTLVPSNAQDGSDGISQVLKSWSIAPFYIPLIVIGCVIAFV